MLGAVTLWLTLGGVTPVGVAPAAAAAAMEPTAGLAAAVIIRQAELTAPGGAADDLFGYSVAVSGDIAVVGVPQDDMGGNDDQGAAFVFTRSGTNWTLQQQLVAGDAAAGDYFGWSVALSGDTALIGAPGDDIDGNDDQGSAYVFVREVTGWHQQAKLTTSGFVAGATFAMSVALSGDTALVGAWSGMVANRPQGSAYVFVRTGSSWSQQAQLTLPGGETEDDFGYSVAVSGHTALVGALGGNDEFRGSAYVFVRSGTAWSQQAQLTAADGAAGDWFGYSVAVSGDTALIGAGGDDVGDNEDQGSAYVFARSGTNWSQQKLTADDGRAADAFGWSVAASGDSLLVGAPFDDVGSSGDQGSAYRYTLEGGTWTGQKRSLDDAAAGDGFGLSVALSGETALIGAPYRDAGGADEGSAYVFVSTAGSDLLAPVTSASLFPSANAAGWNDSAVTLTLSATDGGSGVDKVYYRTSIAGSFHEYDPMDRPAFADEGIAGIQYFATDRAGNTEAIKTMTVKIDQTAPTTTVTGADSAWHNGPVTLTFSAGDNAGGSGVARTEYKLGAGAWITGSSLTISAAGSHTVSYRAADKADNVEAAKSCTVKIDTSAPTTTVTGADSAWHNSPVKLAFSAGDNAGGSGVARTEYKLDAGAWITGSSLTVSAAGSHSVSYRAADKAGNVETAKSATVRIDTGKPTTKAFKASVKKGKKVKLGYQVNDPLPGSGQAKVTLKIFKGKKLKKTIKPPGTVACNARKSQSWKCTLAKGAYTLKVYATDICGNAQSKVGSARLTVK